MAKRRKERRSRKGIIVVAHWHLVAVLGLLVLGAVAFVNLNSHGKPNVLGVATSNYRSATVYWNGVPNAKGYNIYFKEKGESRYIHSVRNLPWTSTSYTVNYLLKNKNYEYVVKAYDFSKKEFWWSEPKVIWSSK